MKKNTLLLITILCSIIVKAQDVSTFVGSTGGFLNATGTSAKFNRPKGVCSDGAGNLYVTDTNNHRIRKIVIATGVVSTLAGSTSGYHDATGTLARFNGPSDICSDGAGNLYVADYDNHRIRKIVIATGVVSTLAGSTSGYLDTAGTSAKFNGPAGVCSDGTGNLYVADLLNHRIRKIAIATKTVSTLAGSTGGYLDAAGTSAKFNYPYDVCSDGTGNLYISDTFNYKIRKIILTTGVVSTLAGSTAGFADDTGTLAQFNITVGICSDDEGNLYVADVNNHKIRKIVIATGVVSTLAGTSAGFYDAAGVVAQFNSPNNVCYGGSGNLYVADASNHKIRKISNVSLSIQDNSFDTKLSIYPNPSNKLSKIQLGAVYNEVNVEVFDVFGKQISTLKHNNTNEISLNSQQFNPGIYVVKVQSGTKQASLKLVVK